MLIQPAQYVAPVQPIAPGVRGDVVAEFMRKQPYPLLFVTFSGAHLYGFSSADSDYDLRGSHVTPVRLLCKLDPPSETVEVMDKDAPVEMDVVTHDVGKFFRLLLKNNGYVLEQIFSDIVVATCDEHAELKAIAVHCITRNHRHHYMSFAHNQWDMVIKGGKPTVKGLLYTYRVLLAGIHLMRTGRVESNLVRLNDEHRSDEIAELIRLKVGGAEKQELAGKSLLQHERKYASLQAELEAARTASSLPEEVDPVLGRAALDDLLVRVRMQTVPAAAAR
ncbi:MAG: nucleotidyltransferase domain-containing protein [Phycisphaerales bacterium]|nr:nucleotidyltransferase domain-containing protein [Phycisphaerales bacterium]